MAFGVESNMCVWVFVCVCVRAWVISAIKTDFFTCIARQGFEKMSQNLIYSVSSECII